MYFNNFDPESQVKPLRFFKRHIVSESDQRLPNTTSF